MPIVYLLHKDVNDATLLTVLEWHLKYANFDVL